jgi:hypothetical protein
MNNAEFKNIMIKNGNGGVIYIEGCPYNYNPYFCGTIHYNSGRVSYLNNGYELSSSQRNSVFISGDGFYSISITDVAFKYDIINNTYD